MTLGIVVRGSVWLHDVATDTQRNWFIEDIYYPTWMRLDGLLVGVMLASLRVYRPQQWERLQQRSSACLLGGLLVCGLAFWLFRERTGLLANTLGWPVLWRDCMAHYSALSREQIRTQFAAFCDARPVGAKFAHRACDGPAGSSPSMKWVNPPVAYMLHAGVPLLRAAQAWCPAHETSPGTPSRIALEAYPGLLAREVLGARSYKSDTAAKQTPERLIARKDLIDALEQGRTRLGLRVRLSAAQRDGLADDASGDALDALLCLVQVAWAAEQPGYGLPAGVDPLEGWIVSA